MTVDNMIIGLGGTCWSSQKQRTLMITLRQDGKMVVTPQVIIEESN